MKLSIVTVTFNSASFLCNALDSILFQSYPNIEYLIIDGGSTDGTLDIIKHYNERFVGKMKYVSEPDKGIYDAMNKGIRMATGDVIGILNSDDFFSSPTILETVAHNFTSNIDALYGDVQFVDREDTQKIVRYYSSKKFTPARFKYGFMPAHPSFYARRELFERYGCYKDDYRIAADFELLLRFMYTHKIRTKYLEMPFVSMRTGGVSNQSFHSRVVLNQEIIRACRENGIKTNLFNVYSKYFFKVAEFITYGRK